MRWRQPLPWPVSVPHSGGESDHQYRQDRHHLGQGAVPLLRDRLLRAGGLPGWPRRGDPGDPDAPVNRGLNCIKGYFLSKIMYGEDRLTQPMLRMTNGKFDKGNNFAPIPVGIRAFDIMAEKFKATLKKGRPPSACSAPASGPSGKAMPPPS